MLYLQFSIFQLVRLPNPELIEIVYKFDLSFSLKFHNYVFKLNKQFKINLNIKKHI